MHAMLLLLALLAAGPAHDWAFGGHRYHGGTVQGSTVIVTDEDDISYKIYLDDLDEWCDVMTYPVIDSVDAPLRPFLIWLARRSAWSAYSLPGTGPRPPGVVAVAQRPQPGAAANLEITVRSTDIDVNGHVNNARVVEYLQWGRWAWLAERGWNRARLQQLGVTLVVVHLEVDYHAELREGDVPTVATQLTKLGQKSLTFRQQISRPGAGPAATTATVVVVAVDPANHQSRALPAEVRRELEP